MSRPMSDVMQLVYNRLELCSSVWQSLDDCQRYGDITQIEYKTAERMIDGWYKSVTDGKEHNVTQKRQAFKKYIEELKANERYCIR